MLHLEISRDEHYIIVFEFSISQILIKNFAMETGPKAHQEV